MRLLEKRHAKELFALTDANRTYLRQWLPWLDATKTAKDTRGYIGDTLKQYADNLGFAAGIWHKGKIAGVAGYHSIDWGNRKVNIGYWLAEEHQGRGIITKGSIGISTGRPCFHDV